MRGGGDEAQARTIGLGGATGVGVGAIVGGGIFVLAGIAYAESGPGATIAFVLNAVLAYVAAFSFAELTTRFPANGGTYAFAMKVLSVRSAFAVGWVLWFAHIVTGVLYALGFATFTVIGVNELSTQLDVEAPAWLASRNFSLLLASAAVLANAFAHTRKKGGGGQWANVGKVVVFVIIIAGGTWALARQPVSDTAASLTPLMPGGFTGLLAAMGFTFIALQGVGLIAAVGGEIRDPRRNVPRAMFISLTIAVVLYIPLVFLVSTVGVEPGHSIREAAIEDPEGVFATGVRRFMGAPGYWFVIVAAILSTLSALSANLLAGSRVALSMGRDRTLPNVFAQLGARGTPVIAVYATALALVGVLFMVPDLAAAGAAASLIFLVAYVLTHLIAYLARGRGAQGKETYRAPFFPLIPILGMVTSAAVAIFQALRVPSAGGVAIVWLGLGVLLYLALFKDRAETADESAEARDPELGQLRGKNPLVLVPVAHPAHARSMIDIANTMAPSGFARVLLLTVVPPPRGGAADPLDRLDDAQKVVKAALETSFAAGHAPVAMISAASPWEEIRRIASEHACQSLLLGMGEQGAEQIEELINDVDCDVAIVRSDPAWQLRDARRILVPVGGGGEEHGLRARMLAALGRDTEREVTFATVCPTAASAAEVEAAERTLQQLVESSAVTGAKGSTLRGDDPAGAIVEAAAEHDLVVVGLGTVGWSGKKVIGAVPRRIALEAPCATILLSRRRPSLRRAVYAPLGAMLSATTPQPDEREPGDSTDRVRRVSGS